MTNHVIKVYGGEDLQLHTFLTGHLMQMSSSLHELTTSPPETTSPLPVTIEPEAG
jgi:hypothetical protein